MTLWLTLLLALNPLAPLISLGSIDTRIRQDMRYASMDNFTHQRVYRFHRCYLLPQTAQALHRAQRQLEAEGFGLKVWDCFRPLSAQRVGHSRFASGMGSPCGSCVGNPSARSMRASSSSEITCSSRSASAWTSSTCTPSVSAR